MASSFPAFALSVPLARSLPSSFLGVSAHLQPSSAASSSRIVRCVISNDSLAISDSESTNSVARTIIEDGADASKSSIQTLEDIEEIVALANEYNLCDLRLSDHGVSVEITRSGGRGFEDGKLASIPQPTVISAGEGMDADLLPSMGVPEADLENNVAVADFDDDASSVEQESAPAPDLSDPDTVYDSDFVVSSNRVGFFFSGAKNKPPLVNVGDHVNFNQPVCIIEQLGQQYVYLSEASGTVLKIFVEDGDSVEFGQRVMVIRPD